jgi:hypothetical protein
MLEPLAASFLWLGGIVMGAGFWGMFARVEVAELFIKGGVALSVIGVLIGIAS